MAISPQRLTIYLYSAHRVVIFAIAQIFCYDYYYYNKPKLKREQLTILSQRQTVV